MITFGSDLIKDALIKTRGNVTKTAESIGMTREALHARIAKDEDLQAALSEAREIRLDRAEKIVEDHLDRNDLGAAKFVLSRLGRHRGWGEKVEVSGQMTQRTEIVLLEIPDNKRGVKTIANGNGRPEKNGTGQSG